LAESVYQRVLLKLSGTALADESGLGVSPTMAKMLAEQIVEAHSLGVQLGVVIGAGNIWRGREAENNGMDRSTADYIGMLATVMNSLALQEAIESLGCDSRVQSAIEMREVAEPYIRRRAIKHLSANRIVIFGAGSGNPYFTTDTAGALRAMEIGADIYLKATQVNGVFDKDPIKFVDATKFDRISYLDALNLGVEVMDATAFSLCMEHKMPICVFSLDEPNSLTNVLLGKKVGTMVDDNNVG
tara:strand:- start:1659 stop:2387 length:729 start_codon:yes stop_codon:yes gene_type:complete